MSSEALNVIRQYDFTKGPNYTDPIYTLEENELAETENMFCRGTQLRQIHGATRIISATVPGSTSVVINSLTYYANTVASSIVGATLGNRLFAITAANPTGYITIASGLSQEALQFWDWTVFNGTLIATSGSNAVKKWVIGAASVSNLGGSPPQGRYVERHSADYVLIAGHDASKVRYCDTANAESWPVGNELRFGRDDGQLITGLIRFGERTLVFKTASVWALSGQSPADFVIAETLSPVGTGAPGSIVLTHAGVFFWSEAGPTIWNGLRTIILSKRMQSLMDVVDWERIRDIRAGYYPKYKQVWVAYTSGEGQSTNNAMMIVDLTGLEAGDNNALVWPVTVSSASAMTKPITGSSNQLLFGHATGHITAYNLPLGGAPAGPATFNSLTVTPRVRTRAHSYGQPDHTIQQRDIITRVGARSGNLTVKYAADGATSFTTHAGSPYSMANSGKSIQQKKLQGSGSGGYVVGNVIQLEYTTSSATGFELIGYEVGLEPASRRESN